MAADADTATLLEPVLRLAAQQVTTEEQAAFAAFLGAYYQSSTSATLRQRTPPQLLEIALRHWQLARQTRRAGQALVRVYGADDGAPSAEGQGLSSLQTVVEDMPFLVESIGMAVRGAGSAVDWIVHPVLALARDEQGRLSGIASAAAAGESLIHMEFEALADEAAHSALQTRLQALLADLHQVVADFPAMRARILECASQLRPAPGGDPGECAEASAFLRWLENDHFSFLGYEETDAQADAQGRIGFAPRAGSALGLARHADPDQLIAPRQELDKYSDSTRVLVVTKAAHRSPIQHPELIDVISVKRFAADGRMLGTCRFIGLFSADAYIERPDDIPLLRRKVAEVMRRSQLRPGSFSEKNLREILHQLPRDELFQSSEDELFETCVGIRALRDRQPLRLFMRRDRYGRFYSCLVYLPRERYSRELRDRIGSELMAACGGVGLDRNTDFLRNGLARIHLVVRTPPGTRIALSTAQLEARLLDATRSWREQLREMLGADRRAAAARWLDVFPLSYQERNPATTAAVDLGFLQQLSATQPLLPRLQVETAADGAARPAQLTLYAWQQRLPLSDVLPILENFGLRVIWQDASELHHDGQTLWIQQFQLQSRRACALDAQQSAANFETAFLRAWRGDDENDGLDRLVLMAGLTARQVVCLRALTRYLLQTALPFGQDYLEDLLAEHAPILRLLVQLFEQRFDPALAADARQAGVAALSQTLETQLDAVASPDADRLLRAYLATVRACLRTNYFQRSADGGFKRHVSLKLDPRRVPELPAPLPMFEIFVYAPEVEGIHLRGGRVARGGLRWSDRRQDFRTEVLGLMKAQMVKNAIIVPVGAKGGFVVKQGDPSDREAWMRQGVACYRTFLSGLLDITDNRDGETIVPPPAVLRYDEDDPYLVVAADKGTASFSDIANQVAADYGFWLGDAFASGGSAGYDHKKMGITARGAWESVKRHFREAVDGAGNACGRDVQSEPFTVVGIGDMSGDVFGNGLLQSRHARLIAAFDHRHIFIDPSPDAARSYAERERLFQLPRSSWADYDTALLSPGGGVWPRSAKRIELSAQARQALGIEAQALSPTELLKAILCAPVDLLWNGGIGTYVKGRHQSHEDCGDRANDAIRIDGRALRCKVVGEGGNLGFTQPGRIEAAAAGVRLNTDFIDNAGGVNSSDREVNIKIPLNLLMTQGALSRAQRDPLLASMTEALAAAVLRDNAEQGLALSLMERDAVTRLDEHGALMHALERDGLLNRAVEFLPDEEVLKERRAKGRGLTRPELAVLLSYSKISLYDALLPSNVPDDPHFEGELLAYFPRPLVEAHGQALQQHRLRREIIATILANTVVDRLGFSFVHRHAEERGVPRADVVKAYAIAQAIFEAGRYWLPVQALDGRVPAELQLRLFGRTIGLMKHVTRWLIDAGWSREPIATALETFRSGLAEIDALLPALLPEGYRSEWDQAATAMRDEGVPDSVAATLANTLVLGSAPDIVELAAAAQVPVAEAAQVYFLVGERLHVLWLLSAINGFAVQGRWQALARANLRDDAYRLHRQLAQRVLQHPGTDATARFEAWRQSQAEGVRFGLHRLQALQATGAADFMTLAVAVRQLRELRQL